MLTETTLGIIHARLAHVSGPNILDVPRMNPAIHLRCLSLMDSLLVHLSGIWVEASVSGRGVQLLLGDSHATALLCLWVGKVGWTSRCEDRGRIDSRAVTIIIYIILERVAIGCEHV